MRRALVVLPLLAVALAGCSTAPTPPTPSPTTTPTTAVSGQDPCLVGTWNAAPGDMTDFIQTQIHDAGSPTEQYAVATVDGTMGVEFRADGTFSYSPSATMTIQWSKGIPETGSIDGTSTGTWHTVSDLLVAQLVDPAATLHLTLGGQVVDGQYGWADVPFQATTYECDTDSLTLQLNAGPTTFPITLQKG